MHTLARRWRLPVSALITVACCLAVLAGGGRGLAASGTVSITVQTMDSCKQALDGAGYILSGGGLAAPISASSAGTGEATVTSGSCPLEHGNCSTMTAGCLTLQDVPVPGTYRIQAFKTPPANSSNPGGYAPCNGGSACQSEVGTVTVAANGSVSASTLDVYPDGTTSTYPSSGSLEGTPADPVVFHMFGLGSGSCDGDGDADDHLTGTPSSHCRFPESGEATACQPFPWSCALASAAVAASGSTSSSGSGTTTTTTTTRSTSGSRSTTSSTTSTWSITSILWPTTTSTTTTRSTSSSTTTAFSGPTSCANPITTAWSWQATDKDARDKHVLTSVAGPMSATLSAPGATHMTLSIQDSRGHTLVSATGASGNLTVSIPSLPASTSVEVLETVTFPNPPAKYAYGLTVTGC